MSHGGAGDCGPFDTGCEPARSCDVCGRCNGIYRIFGTSCEECHSKWNSWNSLIPWHEYVAMHRRPKGEVYQTVGGTWMCDGFTAWFHPEPPSRIPTMAEYLDDARAKMESNQVGKAHEAEARSLVLSEARGYLLRTRSEWPLDADTDRPMELTKVAIFGPRVIAVLNQYLILEVKVSDKARETLERLGGSVTCG